MGKALRLAPGGSPRNGPSFSLWDRQLILVPHQLRGRNAELRSVQSSQGGWQHLLPVFERHLPRSGDESQELSPRWRLGSQTSQIIPEENLRQTK